MATLRITGGMLFGFGLGGLILRGHLSTVEMASFLIGAAFVALAVIDYLRAKARSKTTK